MCGEVIVCYISVVFLDTVYFAVVCLQIASIVIFIYSVTLLVLMSLDIKQDALLWHLDLSVGGPQAPYV